MRITPFIIAACLGLLAALATWTRPGDPALSVWNAGDQPVEVQILDNGFHTDIAVPRRALEARGGALAEAVRALPSGDWILIGWGDAKFYVDQSPISDRLPDGARAFFRPGNASVVMLDPAQTDPGLDYAAGGRRLLRLTPAAFDRMADRVEASLDLSTGAARVTTRRAGDDALFFASRETFSILHLCNHWTGEVLNAAGLPVRPVRSVTSAEVLATVDRVQPTLDTTGSGD